MGVPQLQQAASKGDGVPQLEVDKLEPDVCDGPPRWTGGSPRRACPRPAATGTGTVARVRAAGLPFVAALPFVAPGLRGLLCEAPPQFDAADTCCFAHQPAPDGQLRLFCGGRAVGLDDLLKRRRDARRLTAPPRPLLLHLLGRLVQPQRLPPAAGACAGRRVQIRMWGHVRPWWQRGCKAPGSGVGDSKVPAPRAGPAGFGPATATATTAAARFGFLGGSPCPRAHASRRRRWRAGGSRRTRRRT
eukprot:4933962-Prymnesium_polylepis.1